MNPPGGVTPPGACGTRTVPANVQALLATRCQLCHGNPPLAPVPGSLVNAEDFLRPAKTDPARSTGDVVLARITAAGPTRMPPPPAEPLTAAETEALRLWLGTGLSASACPQPPGPGTPPGTGAPPSPRPDPVPGPDPFAVPARCTSGRSQAGEPSPVMNPGEACIDCHSRRREGGDGDDGPLDPTLLDGEHGGHEGEGEGGEGGEGHGGRGEGGEGGDDEGGPRFAFAGTVYPSPHEPNRCWGVSGGAQVVVMDASGRTFTAPVNAAGNYYMGGQNLTPPLRAKVTFMGRERIMIGSVPHGDCNRCHTQTGNTTVTGGPKAPGRIILP
jgi:cytochrome c553